MQMVVTSVHNDEENPSVSYGKMMKKRCGKNAVKDKVNLLTLCGLNTT